MRIKLLNNSTKETINITSTELNRKSCILYASKYLVGIYQGMTTATYPFSWKQTLFYLADQGSRFLRSAGKSLPGYTVLHL
jgi:hypothetical protein